MDSLLYAPAPAQRVLLLPTPRGHRTLALAWRGHGAGVARAIGHFLGLGGAGVARAWRGRCAGMSCDPRSTPGRPQVDPGLATGRHPRSARGRVDPGDPSLPFLMRGWREL
eukprot:gene12423-biopygen7937